MTAPAGDGAELLALYETTIDDVYRYASRLTGGDRARTDDLVQETYLGVLRRLQAGEHLELTAGYLIVACRSRFLDQLKAEHRRTAREQHAAAGELRTPAEPRAALATEALLTVTSHREDRGPTTYVALEALESEDSPDLSGAWFANDVPVVIDGRSVVAPDDEPIASDVRFVLSGGSFDAFRYRDGWIIHPDGRVDLGGPFVGWVGHQLWGFIVLTPNDPSVLDPHGQQLVDQLVGRTWVGVDGPWRTTSPTLLFDSLDREPGLLGVVVDNGCNRGDGTFRLDGDRMIASEIAIEEAGCDHEVAYLVDGTTLVVDDRVLTVTSTSGHTITTTYVALDSLDAVRSPGLTGDWSANGIPITIAGTEVTAAPDAPAELLVALRNALDDESLEAFRRDDGWIVRSASGTVQLEPS